MKFAALLLAIALTTGCAAPPPVKIASKLLGRNVLNEAKDAVTNPDGTEVAGQQ